MAVGEEEQRELLAQELLPLPAVRTPDSAALLGNFSSWRSMATRALREVGRRRSWAAEVGRRCFSGGSAGAPVAEPKEGGAGGGKAVNLFTAVNQALHIALETDPR